MAPEYVSRVHAWQSGSTVSGNGEEAHSRTPAEAGGAALRRPSCEDAGDGSGAGGAHKAGGDANAWEDSPRSHLDPRRRSGEDDQAGSEDLNPSELQPALPSPELGSLCVDGIGGRGSLGPRLRIECALPTAFPALRTATAEDQQPLQAIEDQALSSSQKSSSASSSSCQAGEAEKSITSAHKPSNSHSFFSAREWHRYLHLPSPASPEDMSSVGAPWHVDLDQLEIGDVVATGSFGMVNMAIYKGQQVAVKSLLIPEASSVKELNKLKAGFRQEIGLWYTLRHPNIVQEAAESVNVCLDVLLLVFVRHLDNNVRNGVQSFIGASINPPKWAIVTEYLEGGSLKAFLMKQQKKKLPVPRIVEMALDIARGMEYLHQHNIMHRDLKSANLLLDSQGVVKVADFGLARLEAEDPGNMTAETGTIRWMAPEVIGHKPYTRKIDVYSFGIVLWELCTCLVPFEGLAFVQLAHAVANDNHRPPTSACDPSLASIMSKCWHPDPSNRPDFVEVVQMLEAVELAGTQNIKSMPSTTKETVGVTRSSSKSAVDPYSRQTVSMRGGQAITRPRAVYASSVVNTEEDNQDKMNVPGCQCIIL